MTKSTILSIFLLSSGASIFGAEYFASPTAAPGGTGSIDRPLDLGTALNLAASPLRGGDTLWLREGTYTAPWGGYISTVEGEIGKPVVIRNYKGERARIDGSLVLRGRDAWLWGLEITTLSPHPSPLLTRAEQWAGMANGTIRKSNLMLETSPRSKVINCVVHQNYNQIQSSASFNDTEFYGNIVAGNGSRSADYSDGHGIYLQNRGGAKWIADNIFVNNYLEGIHAYSANLVPVDNVKIIGNILYGHGMQGSPGGRNIIVGTAAPVHGLEIRDNVMYSSASVLRPNALVGYSGSPQDPVITGNLAIHGGFTIRSCAQLAVTENTIIGRGEMQIFWPREAGVTTRYEINRNRLHALGFQAWDYNEAGLYERRSFPSSAAGFSGWQAALGFDLESEYAGSFPSSAIAVIRPNKYEAGRAHVAIYNPGLAAAVEIDPAGILAAGDRFELRNAEDFYGAPVMEGTYGGGVLRAPMEGVEFRGFVLLSEAGVEPVPVNTAPTLSELRNLTTRRNTATAPVAFQIGDAETKPELLGLVGSSSNPSLVPNGNILFSTGGADRTLVVVPAMNQSGTATISVSVHDGTLVTTRSFVLTVSSENAAPAISAIVDQTVDQNGASAALGFTVRDEETPAGNLAVTGRSSDALLIPDANIRFGGSGGDRTVTLTPAKDRYGSCVITLRVSDGLLSAATSFGVTVRQTMGKVVLTIEAESGKVEAPMSIVAESRASQGKCIASYASEKGLATFQFTVPAAGDYVVWGRAISSASNRDSFYVRMDGGAEDIYDTALDGRYSGDWKWTRVNGRALRQNPRVFKLGAGSHTLVFRGRDNPTFLDKLIITNDRDFTPGN